MRERRSAESEGVPMRLGRGARIGPWSALEVRQILRRFGAEARDLPAVLAALRVPEREARRVLARLGRAGYLRRDPERPDAPRWCRTPRGADLAQACVGWPLSRARAERMLQGVLRRVADIHRNPYFLCRVTAVGVFGSYLTDAPVIDELDLVVRIVPKPPAPGTTDTVFRPDRNLPYWRLQKLLPRAEWPRWRERHVELHVVSGKRHLVLHTFDDPLLRGQRVRLVFLANPEVLTLGTCGSKNPD